MSKSVLAFTAIVLMIIMVSCAMAQETITVAPDSVSVTVSDNVATTTVIAVSPGLASLPSNLRESRVGLNDPSVRSDRRYSAMIARFGLDANRILSQCGEGSVPPAGSVGWFTWGPKPQSQTNWTITPEQAAYLPGVLYDVDGEWFIHCQKGCGGNAIVFYGKRPAQFRLPCPPPLEAPAPVRPIELVTYEMRIPSVICVRPVCQAPCAPVCREDKSCLTPPRLPYSTWHSQELATVGAFKTPDCHMGSKPKPPDCGDLPEGGVPGPPPPVGSGTIVPSPVPVDSM